MRNYTSTEKTATFRNLHTNKEITVNFPVDDDLALDNIYSLISCHGMHDYIVIDLSGFYGLVDSEWCGVYSMNDIAERLEALEDDDAEKLEAMAEYCDDLDDVERAWDDSYFIADTTGEDYAQELCYECGYMPSKELPDWISYHIDWEGVFRELSADGYTEINGGVLYVAK